MGFFRLVAIFSIVPGASHLSLQAYSHFGVYFYLGSFIAIGIIQIILGFRVWRGELSERAFWACTLINGIATVFWLLTRMMYAPFMGGVEHFSLIGVAVGGLQVLFIGILCWRRKSIRDTIIVIVLSLVLGFMAHAGAMATERIFPELKGTGSHSHGHSDETDHAEGEMNHDDQESQGDVEGSGRDAIVETLDTTGVDEKNMSVDDSHDDEGAPHGH